jgi:hypothetical protein
MFDRDGLKLRDVDGCVKKGGLEVEWDEVGVIAAASLSSGLGCELGGLGFIGQFGKGTIEGDVVQTPREGQAYEGCEEVASAVHKLSIDLDS